MPRFFVGSESISEENIYINGADAWHIARSLRMKTGDGITVCCQNVDYECVISRIRDEEIVLNIVSKKATETEPDIKLTLFQAMPKSDKLDMIVQKAVELGVSEIVPVLTARCVSRPDKKSFEKKRARLQKIAAEAAKQSGRGIIPKVGEIIKFEAYLKLTEDFDLNIMCYEGGGERLAMIDGINSCENVSLFIGSEGGLDEKEVSSAQNFGVKLATLGKRILRCETAPLCAVSIIMSLSGNI